jgi:hypothetical protein
VVPDGQGGAFVPWWKDLGNYATFEAHVTHVSASGVSDVVLPLHYQDTAIQSSNVCPMKPGQLPCTADFRLVLGENGVAFATDLQSVVAFNIASMAPLWSYSSASGMDLVAATADGGVTIKDVKQGLVPLDANGNAAQSIGQATPLASFSWEGDLFGVASGSGALSRFFAKTAVDWAHSFWAAPGGSPSSASESLEMPWFPLLPSCDNPNLNPPIACPGPAESIGSALDALRPLVKGPCLNCAAFVFQPLGSIDDQTGFSTFLSRKAGMYDGTRSKMPLNRICGIGSWSGFLCSLIHAFDTTTVADYFQANANLNAMSQMPAQNGLLVFFRPSKVCLTLSSQTLGIFNQARLFHEALHGFYGKDDGTIEQAFGVDAPSINITFYIQRNVFGEPAVVCGN